MVKYKAYPEYKDSGVEWLGDIPTHWDCTALKRLCSLITGLTPPTQNEDNYADEGYPWVRPEDLNESGFGTHASKYVSDIGWKLLRHIKPNSTLICCIGTIGKCGYVKETVSTNQQITAATFRDCERFNYYLLQAARAQLEELATGNVLKILNSERLGALNVVKVNRKEANTIAEFLDHETTKIDDLIEKQQQLIELLKEKRQAVISHAVTKGLNPDVPMKDSGVEWLGDVPEHWRRSTPIKYLSSLKGRLGWQGLKADEYRDEGPYVVSSAHFNNYEIDWNSCPRVSLERYKLDSNIQLDVGDILLMKDGAAMGKLSYVDQLPGEACLNSHLLLFRPLMGGDEKTYDTKFMFYLMQTNHFQSFIKNNGTGSTFLGISQQAIGNHSLCLPPYNEQVEISNYLDDELSKIVRLETMQLEMKNLLTERRTALISAAVTGKIDVRDWAAPDTQDVDESQEATV
ncbi:restriction endonuclease subunit S [Enterobacter roggenkampii]